MHAEPGNAALARRLRECEALRAAGTPTVPSTIGLEKATNVFLRCGEPSIVDFTHPGAAHPPSPVAVLAALREAKNAFKG